MATLRSLLAITLVLGLALIATTAVAQTRFEPVRPMFIAALGDPSAQQGSGAETWGIWPRDPGHTGVWLRLFKGLEAVGVGPGNWRFDIDDWWLDENGLIMQAPIFPIPPGKYLVTGEREAVAALTIHPPDADGNRNWELDRDAKLFDVTHLPCRSARFTPLRASGSCTPANVDQRPFPLAPAMKIPPVSGCKKKDYQVLIVIGLPARQKS